MSFILRDLNHFIQFLKHTSIINVSRDSFNGQFQGIKSCRIKISSIVSLKTFFKGKRFAKCAVMFLCKVRVNANCIFTANNIKCNLKIINKILLTRCPRLVVYVWPARRFDTLTKFFIHSFIQK